MIIMPIGYLDPSRKPQQASGSSSSSQCTLEGNPNLREDPKSRTPNSAVNTPMVYKLQKPKVALLVESAQGSGKLRRNVERWKQARGPKPKAPKDRGLEA